MNPQAAIIPNITKTVIKICTIDLDKLVEQDYEVKINEAEISDDELLPDKLQRELCDGISPMSTYSNITTTETTLKIY